MTRKLLTAVLLCATITSAIAYESGSLTAEARSYTGAARRFFKRISSAVKHKPAKHSARTKAASTTQPVTTAKTEVLLPTAFVKCSEDTDLVIKNNKVIKLTSGEVLVAARNPVCITDNNNKVIVGRHAIVSVRAYDGVFVVRALSEAHRNSVKLIVDETVFELPAGHELLWAQNEKTLETVAQSDGVQRRLPKIVVLPNGSHLLACEFSAVSLIKDSPILRPMVHSSSRNDKIVFGKIMKTTACLAVVTGYHGGYRSIITNTAVACSGHNQPVSYTQH